MSSILLHTTFVFAVLGTKIVLALWVIYYLFPGSKTCPECDEETLSVQMGLPQRMCGAVLFLGKVRRRWCPECGWDGFARPFPAAGAVPRPVPERDPADLPR